MGEAVAGVRAAVDPTPGPSPWALDRPEGAPVDPALGGALRVGPVPAGSGGLVGSAGSPGAVVVASDALLAHLERLVRLSADLDRDANTIRSLPPVTPDLLGALSGGLAASAAVADAHAAVQSAAEIATRARDDLRVAIGRYAAAEADQRARVVQLGEQLGALLGPVLRGLALLGLPALVAARGVGLLGDAQVRAVRDWLLANPELVTSPAFVEAVRASVMGSDEAVSTAVGLPPGALELLGGGAGFTGVEVGAALAVGGAGMFGLFREGPISVERTSTMVAARGPQGAEERLARVPEGDQVRIERYEAPAEAPRWIVYVGPTETFSPVAADEPWDLTSNVTAVAGLSAGSERATVAAMHDAGVAAGDEVQFVGFSQGGLIASRLAASDDWNAVGLETYGAPAGDVVLPAGLAGMAVRNSDDFVPALAGPQRDHHLLQVERRAFDPGQPIPDELPAPAHQRSAYVATASVIDQARSEAVRGQVAAMDAFTTDYTERDGARVTVMTYRGERGAERALSSGDRGTTP